MYLYTANLERAYDRGHQSDVRELRGIQEASRGDQIFTQGVIPKDQESHYGTLCWNGRVTEGDQFNAVMSAVGYNMRLILKLSRALLCKIIAAILWAASPFSALKHICSMLKPAC